MTLLTIAQGLAKNVGLRIPTVILTATEREWAEVLQMANEAGEELARRVDWGVLTSTTALTGDGTNLRFDLPANYARLTSGITIRSASGIVRPLSRAEWNALVPTEGVPRYFLLEGDRVTLWPYLADLATVAVTYQSGDWSSSGASFMADTDTSLISEDVLLKCLIVRWRRQKGMPYADEEAEYEAALADAARFDDRGRL